MMKDERSSKDKMLKLKVKEKVKVVDEVDYDSTRRNYISKYVFIIYNGRYMSIVQPVLA